MNSSFACRVNVNCILFFHNAFYDSPLYTSYIKSMNNKHRVVCIVTYTLWNGTTEADMERIMSATRKRI